MRGSHAIVRRNRFVAGLALSVAAGLTSACADAALSAASRVGFTGVGPIVIGTTPVQAAATGIRFSATSPARGSSCYYVHPSAPAPRGLTFLVEAGTLRRAEVTDRALPTTDGLRIGDPVARAIAFYGSRAHVAPDKYDPAVKTMTIDPPPAGDSKYRMIFKVSAGVLRTIYAGALPQVAYVEGCS